MWSAGVCLYAMIVGCVPFKASSMTKLHDMIKSATYDFEYQAGSMKKVGAGGVKSLYSEGVKDLI